MIPDSTCTYHIFYYNTRLHNLFFSMNKSLQVYHCLVVSGKRILLLLFNLSIRDYGYINTGYTSGQPPAGSTILLLVWHLQLDRTKIMIILIILFFTYNLIAIFTDKKANLEVYKQRIVY